MNTREKHSNALMKLRVARDKLIIAMVRLSISMVKLSVRIVGLSNALSPRSVTRAALGNTNPKPGNTNPRPGNAIHELSIAPSNVIARLLRSVRLVVKRCVSLVKPFVSRESLIIASHTL